MKEVERVEMRCGEAMALIGIWLGGGYESSMNPAGVGHGIVERSRSPCILSVRVRMQFAQGRGHSSEKEALACACQRGHYARKCEWFLGVAVYLRPLLTCGH
eukprot:TRINITY_DN8946_c0_g1_i1.p2 TRINITY_DN8946_c0_g1~~TRINITY_DN8946_c0_g1_i1.p2  ORF type:complete len:102 (-),score=9.23 TRINITY_DN8946_c0_g1_i1:410-715(-)